MMQPQHLTFRITDDVQVNLDFAQRKAVLRLKTEDGSPLSLEAKYETLDKIHQAIRDKLDAR
jgi:hypothetical protein